MNPSIVSPQSFTVGTGPIFRQMADHVDLVNIVNHPVGWDAAQCRVSPGERIFVLVLDLFNEQTSAVSLGRALDGNPPIFLMIV